jgi:hypothetical protein
MADLQTIVKTAAGLYSQYNKLHALPPGALLQCENGVIDREGVISKRRGFKRYGSVLSNAPTALFEYRKTLVVQDGSSLKYDSDGAGTWSSWSGTYSPPDSSVKIQSLEANQNFYFTTSTGVFKNDTISGVPKPAGMPMGLDITLALGTTGTVWLTVDNQVAYRVVLSREDANHNLVYGAPSYQEIITNPIGGATSNVEMSITLPRSPHTVQAGDYLEIYRSYESESEDVVPVTRFFRIFDGKITITSSHISAGLVTFKDTYDSSFLVGSLELYTDDLQETESQKNDQPPYCKCLGLYKGHVFYGNVSREYHKELTMVAVPAVDKTITLAQGATTLTFTAKANESVANKEFKVFSTGNVALDIRNTCKSLIRVINQHSANSTWDSYYTSLPDDFPGGVSFRVRSFNTASFTVVGGDSAMGVCWDPVITTAVTAVNDAYLNRVARSKYQKPEAVPELNTMEIGRANKAILGMAALKHGLLIFKEDGVFLISGETDGGGGYNFVIDEIDPSVRLTCPNSLAVVDNGVVGYTTQGIVKAFEGGTTILSRAIELDLNPLSQFTNFETISHAIGYESDRKYIFFTQETSGNTHAVIAWVYNYLTNSWSKWRKNISCGTVLSEDNKLYLGHAVDKYVLQERKSYLETNEDYIDEDYTFAVTAVGTTVNDDGATVSTATVTYSDPVPEMGWLFTYTTNQGKVDTAVEVATGSMLLTLDTLLTLPGVGFPYNCTLTAPIELTVEWAPESAGNAGIMKQYTSFQVYQEEDFSVHNELGFYADTWTARTWLDMIKVPKARGWGETPWGEAGWGDYYEGTSTPIRAMIPMNHQRCRVLRTYYRHRYAKEAVNILQATLDVRAYGSRTVRNPE